MPYGALKTPHHPKRKKKKLPHVIRAQVSGGKDAPKVYSGTYGDLQDITIPVMELVARKPSRQFAHQVERVATHHQDIQREFSGAKKTNAQKELPPYIRANIDTDGTWLGPVWTADVWLPDQLEVIEEPPRPGELGTYERTRANIGFLLDCESRCYALELLSTDPDTDDKFRQALLDVPLTIRVYDGLDALRAAQHFADLNGQGVQSTRNLVLGHDLRDPWTKVTRQVFDALGIPLETEARQVKRASDKVLTIGSARTMVAAVARGVSAVSYGAGPIPEDLVIEGDGTVPVDFDKLRDAATAWIGHVFDKFGPEAFRDRSLVLGAVPMIAALGALGRPYYDGDPAGQARSRRALDEVTDWTRGPRWSGVAGKWNANTETFSVGSGKEIGYAAYRALTDQDDEGYKAIHRA